MGVTCQNCQNTIETWTQWWESVCPETKYGCIIEPEENTALYRAEFKKGDDNETTDEGQIEQPGDS